MKKSFIVMAFAGMAILFSSCAKVPQAELDATNGAIENAKLAEADVYMGSEYTAVLDSMDVLNAQIEAGKGKLFKNFSDVKTRLAALSTQADALVANTEIKKAAIKEEVTNGLVQLQTLIGEINALVAQAPKGKEGKAAIEAIKGETDAVTATSVEVSQLSESGNLLGAQTKLNAAIEKATSLKDELSAVVAKYAKKNR